MKMLLALLLAAVMVPAWGANCHSYPLTAGSGFTVVPISSFPTVWHVWSPITVTAIPGSGVTVVVNYTTSPNIPTAIWGAWPNGTVSAYTSNSVMSPIAALEAEAVTANGSVEICQ